MSTLAGQPGQAGQSDGVATAAMFSFPRDIHVDQFSGVGYIADYGNCAIRELDVNSSEVSTFAGGGGCSSGSGSGQGSGQGSSGTSVEVCPVQGPISILITIRLSAHADAGSDNDLQWRLGTDIGLLSETWGTWETRAAPLSPNDAFSTQHTTNFIPHAIEVAARGGNTTDDFGISKIELQFCGIDVTAVEDSTPPSSPGSMTWISADKIYTFRAYERIQLEVTGPAAVTTIAANLLGQSGETAVVIADRSFLENGRVRDTSDWSNTPANYEHGNSFLRILSNNIQLNFGGKAGYADGLFAEFDATDIRIRPNTLQAYVADDLNFVIRRFQLGTNSTPIVETFAGQNLLGHVSGNVANASFARVRRCAASAVYIAELSILPIACH